MIVKGDGQTANPAPRCPLRSSRADGQFSATPFSPLEFSNSSVRDALVRDPNGGKPASSVTIFTDESGQSSVEVVLGSKEGAVQGQVCLGFGASGFP